MGDVFLSKAIKAGGKKIQNPHVEHWDGRPLIVGLSEEGEAYSFNSELDGGRGKWVPIPEEFLNKA